MARPLFQTMSFPEDQTGGAIHPAHVMHSPAECGAVRSPEAEPPGEVSTESSRSE